jgi:hypothetical protein
LEPDGSLYVDDLANARIADQAVVGTLSTVLQTAAGELQLKLTTVTLATVAADVTKGSL